MTDTYHSFPPEYLNAFSKESSCHINSPFSIEAPRYIFETVDVELQHVDKKNKRGKPAKATDPADILNQALKCATIFVSGYETSALNIQGNRASQNCTKLLKSKKEKVRRTVLAQLFLELQNEFGLQGSTDQSTVLSHAIALVRQVKQGKGGDTHFEQLCF